MAHPPGYQPTIEQGPEGLTVTMRTPAAGCLLGFLGAWFVGWSLGGASAFRAVADADSLLNPFTLFMLVWLAGWALGEVAVGYFILFTAFGQETIIIDGQTLGRYAEIFGWRLGKRYPLQECTNLRAAGHDAKDERTFIAFDHAGSTVHMGTGLNETEAARIADAITDFEPRLRPLNR